MKDLCVRRSTAITGRNIARPARTHPAVFRLTGSVLFLAMMMLTTMSFPAWGAQPAAKKPPAPATKKPPTSAAKKPPATQPGVSAAKKPPATQPSGPPLPAGFKLPQEVPAIMKIDKPLMTEADAQKLAKTSEVRNFSKVLWAGERNGAADESIRKSVRYYLHKMTMKEHQGVLHEIREQLLRDLKKAGVRKTKQKDKEAFREFVMKEITTRAEELLDNNFNVRLQAVIILSQLNLLEEGRGRDKEPAVAFTPAAEVLLKVIGDKDQPEAVKIHAVKGLKRIVQLGRPNDDLQHRVAESLIKELANVEYCWWYQMRLTEALGAVDLFLHRNSNTPFILDALSKVLVDRKRHWVVRCQAAKSLGRSRFAPLGGGAAAVAKVNIGLIAHRIADLGRQMADAYNKNPRASYWKDCYFRLYLAFRPIDSHEKARHAGLLLKMERLTDQRLAVDKQVVNEAYQKVVLPLSRDVLKLKAPSQFPKATLDAIDQWLSEQKPADVRIWPDLDPLIPGPQPVADKKPVASEKAVTGKKPGTGKKPVTGN